MSAVVQRTGCRALRNLVVPQRTQKRQNLDAVLGYTPLEFE